MTTKGAGLEPPVDQVKRARLLLRDLKRAGFFVRVMDGQVAVSPADRLPSAIVRALDELGDETLQKAFLQETA